MSGTRLVELGVFFPFKPRYKQQTTPRRHIGHTQHLCYLVEEGKQSIEQIKALINNPNFICKKCGRVAKENKNLCEPIALD
jgi:hypothetical protein